MASEVKDVQQILRELPSVDHLLQTPVAVDLIAEFGRALTVEALRHTLDEQRSAILSGAGDVPRHPMLVQAARERLEALLTPTLQPVINATGIIVHTNLGRAPLSAAALAATQTVGGNYSTLEYDLAAGQRGSRAVHAEELVTRLTGAEAALVVNNNAAGVLLMLTTLCRGGQVIISRGQLVEIGGGFRVPDVMAQSGAHLVEVGTTNRTHLQDYEAAITADTAALFVAHHSNYKIIGFSSEPPLADLAELAHAHNIPLLYDQGSGALLDTTPYGLDPEPTVVAGLEAGCDVVAFSGDKLLGGPQAGILCGQAGVIGRLKRHPLARAVRVDKLCLAALAATLSHYLTQKALTDIPVWRMISRPLAAIAAEADTWAAHLQQQGIRAQAIDGQSKVGGGSLPGTSLVTRLVAIQQSDVVALATALRRHKVPVIGRIQDDRYLVDPRTVLPEQVETLLQLLVKYCEKCET